MIWALVYVILTNMEELVEEVKAGNSKRKLPCYCGLKVLQKEELENAHTCTLNFRKAILTNIVEY